MSGNKLMSNHYVKRLGCEKWGESSHVIFLVLRERELWKMQDGV